jgi:GNAT superfamily N-acetyltransferase
MIGRVPHLSPAAWNDAVVQELTAAQQTELRARYDDGTPIGCGALRPLEPGAAELKRMYVVPAARGRAISRLLLTGLEAEAASRGWTTLRLETGPRQPVGAFGAYVATDSGGSLYFARTLT